MYSPIAKEYYVLQRQSANLKKNKKTNNGLFNLTFIRYNFSLKRQNDHCVFYKQVLLLLLFRCIIQLKN